MTRPVPRPLVALVLACLALVAGPACGSSPTSPTFGLSGGVLATFAVDQVRFRVFVTDPTAIDQLLALRQGTSRASIPNGRILRGPGAGGHNAPYSWHLDDRDIELAETAIELCDGSPRYVESHVADYVDTVGRYCPWGAALVTLVDLR
ncbi:MAG: hypothetical protein R2752_11800 [Vicinamibacterales bacterium]